MRIAVDGYELGREAKGVGRVVRHLLLRLPELLPKHEFLVYTKERTGLEGGPSARECVLPSPGGYLRWQNGPLRTALKETKPDLLIASNYVLPFFCPWRSFLIEHDISVIAHPEWYPRKYALTRRFLVRRSLHRADLVVVPSTSVEKEIEAFFKFGKHKVRVIGWGVEDKFRRSPDEEVERWREKKGLAGKKVIGFLGSIFKRRHVPELVRAVERLRRGSPEAVLHIVGEDFGVLDTGAASWPAGRDWILWENSLPEADLPIFYSSLDAFAYLSEYEGFGFPPLEALACGTVPVLLDGSSLAEVFSGLAVIVKGTGEEEVAAALRSLVEGRGIRESLLAEFGRRRGQFSWDASAAALAGLIREAGKP
jgi:glycosyltransferase involved in cell wall biosynthesis